MGTDANVGNQGGAIDRPACACHRPSRWFKVLLLLIAAGLIAAAAGYYYKFGILVWSEPYEMALKQLTTNQQLLAEVGEPIQGSWFPLGEIDNDPNNGSARLFFRATGPKGKADIQVDARRINGKWGLSQLAATPEGGSRIRIDVGGEGGLDEAPPFKP